MSEQYKICNNCRTKNDTSALKCKSCQAPMTGSMVLNFKVSNEDKSFVVCKNCNTINKSTSLKCTTCNAPMVGSMVIDRNFNPINQPQSIQPKSDKVHAEEISARAASNKTEQFGMKVCKRCAYPNMAIAKSCVKCNNTLDDITTSADATNLSKKSHRPEAEPNIKATVNPWVSAKNETNNSFDLIPLVVDGANHKDKITFEGDNVKLNRLNLDPDNQTITSSEQAVIYKKGNKWMLSDKSKLKTTFIRIDGELEISDGMVIMFGNKCFQFRDETK